MKRLGYTRYVSQGGDWGSVVADAMARQAPAGLLGIHVNMPATVPADIAKALERRRSGAGRAVRRGEGRVRLARAPSTRRTRGYAAMMVTRPQTVGYGLADSPVGLAAWMYDKFAAMDVQRRRARALAHQGRDARRHHALLAHEHRDLFRAALLGEQRQQLQRRCRHRNRIPAAVTVFPGEIYRRRGAGPSRAYHNLIYFNEVDKGGHFAAWEEPELFAAELRAAFRSLR